LHRIKQEEERFAEEERAREAKKPRHQELDLAKLGEQEDWDNATLSKARRLFQHISDHSFPRVTPDQDAFIFEVDEEEEAEVAALRKRLQNLKVVSRAKVTQDRVYSSAYHPETTKDLIFFGGTYKSLTSVLRSTNDKGSSQINTANLEYGMHVLYKIVVMKTTTKDQRANEKAEFTIASNLTGQQPASHLFLV